MIYDLVMDFLYEFNTNLSLFIIIIMLFNMCNYYIPYRDKRHSAA